MTLKTIKAGAQPNDGTGDNLRSGAQIINENFAELDQRAVAADVQLAKLNGMTNELYGLTTGQGHEEAVKAILLKYGIGTTILDVGEDLLDWINVTCAALVRNKGQSRLPTAADHYVVTYPVNATYLGQTAINFTTGQFYTRIKAGGWGGWREFLIKGDYGVGSTNNALYVGHTANPDDYTTGGYVTGQFNIYGWKVGALVTQGGSSATTVSQQFTDYATGKMFSRGKPNGTWTPWQTVLYDGDEAQYIENANGRAIKHKCGALQCWFSSGSTGATTIPIGSLFGSPQYIYTFPVPFVSAPVVVWSTADEAGALVWGVHAASNDTITIGNLVSVGSGATARPQYFATGRWK